MSDLEDLSEVIRAAERGYLQRLVNWAEIAEDLILHHADDEAILTSQVARLTKRAERAETRAADLSECLEFHIGPHGRSQHPSECRSCKAALARSGRKVSISPSGQET